MDVDIEGKTIDNVAVLYCTHQWRAGAARDSRQYPWIRTVELGWRYGSDVFVTAGLSAGERVITTPISFPIVGAPLNVQALGAYDGQ